MSNVYVNSPLLVPATARNKRIYSGTTNIQNTQIAGTTINQIVNQLTDRQISDLVATRQWLHGFEEAASSMLSFVNITRTFTITGDLFRIWNKGLLTKKDTESIIFANTVGSWYIFYNADNELTTSQTAWNRTEDNPICVINWDGSTGVVIDMRYSCFIINHVLLSDIATLDSITKMTPIVFSGVSGVTIPWNLYAPKFGERPHFLVWIWDGTNWLPRPEILAVISTVGNAIGGTILSIAWSFDVISTGEIHINR